MKKLILEAEVFEVANPDSYMDDGNFKDKPNGLYAIFDGLTYQLVQWFNGRTLYLGMAPVKYYHIIDIELKQEQNGKIDIKGKG